MNVPQLGTDFLLTVDITRLGRPRSCPDNQETTVDLADRRRPSRGRAGRHISCVAGSRQASAQVAATETTTCLKASGTGKEVIARFIHQRSPRWRGPSSRSIARRCRSSSSSPSSSDSSVARSPARRSRSQAIGLAAAACCSSTKSPMTPAAQAKFLRVLQEREFLRLGGTRPVRVNVRVIAATNRNLDDAVTHGEFRADLYYRLNVLDIHIPPFRERRDDICRSAGFFRDSAGAKAELTLGRGKPCPVTDWPGNVRELRNALERALIMCDRPFIDAEHLCLRARKDVPLSGITELGILEKKAIERAMRKADGNKVRAARESQNAMELSTVRLREYGSRTPDLGGTWCPS